MTQLFRDRRDAGMRLASQLTRYAAKPGVIVLGLPRGGVPVAAEVARALGAPLDVFTVRKLGLPGNEEFAIGAIASGGTCVLSEALIDQFRVSAAELEVVRATEQRELERRELAFRGDRPPLDVRGSTVIVVDDGLATGATMHAAVTALREQKPLRIVAAVPVASESACAMIRSVADECVCLATPVHFRSVGPWYRDFGQTDDREVHRLLDHAMSTLPEDALRSAAHQRHTMGAADDVAH